jgi:hypothetical protein
MSKSRQRQVVLIQKLITSYFTTDVITEFGSSCCHSFCEVSDSGYVEETPVSKQGNRDFYLGKCNNVDESPRRSLFMSPVSLCYSGSSFDNTPSLSEGRLSVGSPTASSESVAFKK